MFLCDMAKKIDTMEHDTPSRISGNCVSQVRRHIFAETEIFLRSFCTISETSPYPAVGKRLERSQKRGKMKAKILYEEAQGMVLTGK